jgi:hypothetical protein
MPRKWVSGMNAGTGASHGHIGGDRQATAIALQKWSRWLIKDFPAAL